MENDVTGQLPLEDYGRYGRQMIMEGFGLPGEILREGVKHAAI